jgi:hypothetical protein
MTITSREAKIILVAEHAYVIFSKGAGGHDRQRRSLARWQKLAALRRRECPSMIGSRMA